MNRILFLCFLLFVLSVTSCVQSSSLVRVSGVLAQAPPLSSIFQVEVGVSPMANASCAKTLHLAQATIGRLHR